jgi:molybdopterin synthase catalytic subunit
MDDWIDILPNAIDAAGAVDSVLHPSAGGVDVFLGTTRAETRADGVPLIALDYEAYREMAIEQMRSLVAAAKKRWPIARVTLLHRVGRVAVSEASVLIAVSCPHRGQAFEACRFLIDELKKSVTIWKREVWEDESVSWVAGTTPSSS